MESRDRSCRKRAFRWFVAAQQCHGGFFGGGFAVSVDQSRRGMSQKVSGYLSAVERLPKVSRRMQAVRIEQRDFSEIIKKLRQP